MAAFGIEIENCRSISKFVEATNQRLMKEHFLSNPFQDSKLRQLKDTLAVNINPIYLNFPLYAAFFLIPIVWFFKGFSYSTWYIPGLVFLCLTVFWSKYFFYLILKLGLKKAGYKGRMKLLKQEETIKRLIHYEPIRCKQLAKE